MSAASAPIEPQFPQRPNVKPNRWRRDPHVTDMIQYLEPFANCPEKLKSSEIKAIIEEIKRCRESFEYAARNYFWITDKQGRDTLFSLWDSQELILESLYERKRRGLPQKLLILKARQLGCCLDPSTLVLKADLTWVRIDEIKPGDQVVAVDESIPGGRGNGRKMRTASVEARRDVFEEAFRLEMENGVDLVATGEHRFLVRRRGGTEAIWMRVDQLRPGDVIRSVCEPWQETPQYEDGWFGGMIDGEGSISSSLSRRCGVQVCVCQVENSVLDRAKRYLDERGYHYRIEIDRRKSGDSSKLGKQIVYKLVIGRMNEIFRLLGVTRPEKHIKNHWWEGHDLPGRGIRGYSKWVKIKNIHPLGRRRMIDLQTTEKTFIANGYVSHNSTLLEALLAWRTIFYVNQNAIIVSHSPEHAGQVLFQIVLHILDWLPWWLKPMQSSRQSEDVLVFSNKDPGSRQVNPGNESRIYVQAANQKTGVGQGVRISVAHISELGDYQYDKARQIIEGDLGHALVESPETIAVIESTGKVAGSYFHKLWRRQVELGERADWEPRFFPWFFERTHFIAPPEGWQPEREELEIRDLVLSRWVQCDNEDCQQMRESMYKSKSLIGSVCPSCKRGTLRPKELSDGQLCWWEWRRKNAGDDEESLKELLQEQALTPEDAFQPKGTSAFPMDCITTASKFVRPPLIEGFLDKNGIFHGVHPRTGECVQNWCHADHRYDEKYMQVWEFPQGGAKYAVGVDVGAGLGGPNDYSAAVVFKIGSVADYQVATLRTNSVTPQDFGELAVHLASWYNTALLAIEAVKLDSCLVAASEKYQYPNLYENSAVRAGPTGARRYGWYTTPKTKPNIVVNFARWLRARAVEIYSSNLVEEMKSFVRDPDSERAGATKGNHDDELMAAMICLWTAHEDDWNEATGIIKLPREDKSEANFDFHVRCTNCGHEWGTDRPSESDRCLKCGSAKWEAKKLYSLSHYVDLDLETEIYEEYEAVDNAAEEGNEFLAEDWDEL